ncbi:MAG: universal stress protein [Dehalococcoidales bacterium]|nr:universal stress protein [Dehalococcoidales bacterium]
MFNRILVPLDGSRFASRALRYATELAHRFGAEIILIQVVKPTTPILATTGMMPGVVESPTLAELTVQAAFTEDRRNTTRAKRYLSGKVRAIKSRDIKTSYQVIVGDPARVIRELSKKKHIDLVVMTSHGKSGLKRVIMGSVADEVIRESKVSVLIARPRS